jgi:hypothetical protein
VIVNSISALVAGLYWVANSKDLRPWWCPWSRKHAVSSALSNLVNQISTRWSNSLQDIAVSNEKDELEAAVTMYIRQTYCLAMPRWFRHWQKGLLHVVTPHEADGSPSRGVAVRLMEHNGRKPHLTKDPSILPPKQVLNNSQYRTLQETAEQQQRQSIELCTTIQKARAKATVKTEMDVKV